MQTINERAWLRTLTRKRYHRPTAAGAFWIPYLFLLGLLIAYLVVS